MAKGGPTGFTGGSLLRSARPNRICRTENRYRHLLHQLTHAPYLLFRCHRFRTSSFPALAAPTNQAIHTCNGRTPPAPKVSPELDKGLKASGVSVRKLRTNVLGQCDYKKHITLSPILVLMPQRMSDCVMMHEMAHIKHMHHRQSFWKHLSELLGENATAEKYRSDIVITQKNAMIQYLLR